MLLAMTLAADGDWSGAVDSPGPGPARSASDVDDRDVLWNLGNAALQLGDDDGPAALLRARAVPGARGRSGHGGGLRTAAAVLQPLPRRGLVGRTQRAEEALALGRERRATGDDRPPTRLADAARRPPGPRRLRRPPARLEQVAAAHPLGILTDPVHDLTRWAKGIRAAATGDTSGALHHLSRFRLPALSRMAAVDRIDAAVRAEEPDLARAWVDELAALRRGDRPSLGAGDGRLRPRHHCRGAQARRRLFQEALSQHAPSRRVRSTRLAPSWRTASGSAAPSAASTPDGTFGTRWRPSRTARAEALADRATQELRASGETARKRDPSTLVKLTPMELKIAQLVSSGLSNKDVAAQSGSRPGRLPSTCATSSPRPASPPAASSPSSTSPRPLARHLDIPAI